MTAGTSPWRRRLAVSRMPLLPGGCPLPARLAQPALPVNLLSRTEWLRSCAAASLGWAGLAMRRTLPLVQAAGVGTLAPPPPARPCTINVCMLCSCLLSPAPQFFILLYDMVI